jgi:serine phosphatase RsbU (regulator of sigma subunit)
MSQARRLDCAETWAGNEGTASLVELPGLAAWVHSIPAGAEDAGGDVHYVSVCPSCIVSRVALADVSGHGHAVVALSGKLRTLMEKYLTALEPTGLMRDLNAAVQTELDGVHYATMVAVGFHGRRGLLVLSNAGHPPPFWHRRGRDEWAWFEEDSARHSSGVIGTPLGLLPDASYSRTIVKPEPGDLIVLYSDGVSEARDPSGEELGRDRLMEMARRLDSSHAERFGPQLAQAVRMFRGGAPPEDDETIIVLERLSTGFNVPERLARNRASS